MAGQGDGTVKIWGRLTSINVQKVVWAAHEVGVAFERVDVGGPYGGLDTEAYGALNPNRKIPVIDDGGFVLWESNAIVRYLAARYSEGKLWPADVQVRADADRWMDWQATTGQTMMGPVFLGLIRTPEAQRDMAAIAASVQGLAGLTQLLDDQLADGRAYLTGDTFTMGDLAIGCMVHRWYALPIERPERARLAAWFERVRVRPGAQAALVPPPLV